MHVCGLAGILVSVAADAREAPLPRWDWVLSGPIDVPALVARRLDYVGLDAFDTPAETVAALRASGMHVWCYLSAGTIEDWRPDLAAYEAVQGLIGADYHDWPGERWLDVRQLDALMPLMEARLALCAGKGFDMVEFDNIDGYGTDTGFEIGAENQIAFIKALAEAAKRAGLAPILKNAPEFAAVLEPWFAAHLMEDCVLYDFCDASAPFAAAQKPALNAEYPESWAEEGRPFDLDLVCADGRHGDVAMLVKPLELTMEATACP
ncbi:MAG: endo alpha-1,4 polygalactosaminidase [Alphaproteobacteria bacterium]